MAMTPEKRVKLNVTKQLNAIGAYWFYAATHGYGMSGAPDIVGCYYGVFFGIECKAGKNIPTELQHKNLCDIKAMGGFAMVVNEQNMDTVTQELINARIRKIAAE